MDNIEQLYKTSAKQRDASKKYRQNNKDKLNTYHRQSHKDKILNDPIYQQKRKDYAKTAYEKLKDQKYEIEFTIAFIDD